eukprot:scaffold7123_cov119-Isochrysis_galbana.AAC.7
MACCVVLLSCSCCSQVPTSPHAYICPKRAAVRFTAQLAFAGRPRHQPGPASSLPPTPSSLSESVRASPRVLCVSV